VVVLDLGGISWVDVRRIELSTWFRFRRVVENTPTILLLLGEESCAKSCGFAGPPVPAKGGQLEAVPQQVWKPGFRRSRALRFREK